MNLKRQLRSYSRELDMEQKMLLKTKAQIASLVESYCAPLRQYYSSSASKVHFPEKVSSCYTDEIADLESFARPLWGLSGLLLYKKDEAFIKVILDMIRHGTSENDPEYWGVIHPYSQTIVELPSIALFLYVHKEHYNSYYSEEDKYHIAKWFLSINNIPYGQNNWQFFGILVNSIFDILMDSNHRNQIHKHWETINQHYIGDGWYTDGVTKQRDYYIAFAYHFYSLLWIWLDDKIEGEIKNIIIDRAEKFAKDYLLFFAEDGSAIPFGRSLIYRYAQVAFWTAYELNNLTQVPCNVVKGIINRNLRWWSKQDIFNSVGLLNVGYSYHNLIVSEHYNATGSPYWAFKTFLLLLLPSDHEYWKCEEVPLNINDGNYYLQKAQYVISREQNDAFLFSANHRHQYEWGHATAKYEKVVYSTVFGFNVSKGVESMAARALDSTYAISLDGYNLIEKRNTADEVSVQGIITNIWKPDEYITVKCTVIPGAPWHIRIFQIATQKTIRFYDFGYAIKAEKCETSNVENSITLHNGGQTSSLKNLYGNGLLRSYESHPNTNLLYPRNQIPYATWFLERGQYVVVDTIGGGRGKLTDAPTVTVFDNEIVAFSGDKTYRISLNERLRKPVNIISLKERLKRIKRMLS